jgi:hypothetical protein
VSSREIPRQFSLTIARWLTTSTNKPRQTPPLHGTSPPMPMPTEGRPTLTNRWLSLERCLGPKLQILPLQLPETCPPVNRGCDSVTGDSHFSRPLTQRGHNRSGQTPLHARSTPHPPSPKPKTVSRISPSSGRASTRLWRRSWNDDRLEINELLNQTQRLLTPGVSSLEAVTSGCP